MRLRSAALSVLVASALLLVSAPPGIANPTSGDQAAELRAADSAAKAIVKLAGKAMSAATRTATVQIGALNTAAKTGRNVEALSGVVSTPEVKVSQQQREGLLEAAILAEATCQDSMIGICRDAYDEFATSPPIVALAGSEATKRLPGAGGPSDTFGAGLAAAWTKATAAVNKSIRTLQGTLLTGGLGFTHFTGPTPTFTTATVSVAPDHVFDVPVVHSTYGASNGLFRALVSYPGETPVGDYTDLNTAVVYANQSGTLDFDAPVVFDNLRIFPSTEEPLAPVEFRVFVVEGSLTGPVTPTVPLSIVGPGPCAPAGQAGPLVATPSKLHLADVKVNTEAFSEAIFLTNTTQSTIQATASVVASGPNVGKFFLYNTSATVFVGSESLFEVGGSSPTAGNFTAKILIVFPGGSIEVPVDMRVTN